MKQTLFARGRLFELCTLYPFDVGAMTIGAVAMQDGVPMEFAG